VAGKVVHQEEHFMGGIESMHVISKEKTIIFLVTTGACIAALIWLCGQTVAGALRSASLEKNGILPVEVHRLIVDPRTQQPIVILADSGQKRGLFIWIDHFEANAIYSEIEGVHHVRPLTHDLLEDIIKGADLHIEHVIVTRLEKNIYYAKILIRKGSTLMEIDARPSDSIVMALKFKAPISVSETLFREASVALVEEEKVEERYGLTFQELTPSLAKAFSFDSPGGVLVSGVKKQSRAEEDGIERGDIIVEVGGGDIEDVTAMRNALKRGETSMKAKIFRKAHFISIIIHPN